MHSFRLLPLGVFIAALPLAALDAQGCAAAAEQRGRGSSNHTIHRDDDHQLTVRWRRGDCELRLDAGGEFEVRADLTGFTSIAPRGYVEIEERDGRTRRRVRVTPGPDGPRYEWTLNGDERFDVDRERWLAATLVALDRRNGMFAKARMPALLRQGGPNAVLDEAARMEADYARRVYYTALLAATRLDDPQLERLLREAAEAMSSDWERAELLLAVARRGPLTERIAASYVAAARRLTSDYEKRRSLNAVLESVAPIAARRALFGAAATIRSDFELAELLIAAQRRGLVDSLSADAYFTAVRELASDYEHRRTLSALLAQREMPGNVLAGVLTSAAAIDSDFELATLLVEFARRVPVRGDLRERYLVATRTIASDWEYRRALQALLDQDKRT